MKNLYIFWDEPLNITGGGIHRTITTLLNHLPQRGINAYYLYSLDKYQTFHFIDEAGNDKLLNRGELRQFLINRKCDFILGQEGVFSSTFTKVVKELHLDGVKFINQYHNSLLYFDKKLSFYYLGLEWRMNKSPLYRIGLVLRGLLYPIWKHHVNKTQNQIYKYNYDNSDVSLLLSGYEKPIMRKISGDIDLRKCVSIPNPLSWDNIASPEIFNKKKNEVLIVSRIYNSEKRIDLALKIWKILQDRGATEKWVLRIVGDGVHKQYLMDTAESMRLEGVKWEGRSAPMPFYEQASIFLLTSIVEGWALTLTESMQMGVVPIAFDSYPAIRDIITDGYDGFLIPTADINKMADKIQSLMNDNKLRTTMALNGLESCRRFSIDVVMDQWSEMLNNL